MLGEENLPTSLLDDDLLRFPDQQMAGAMSDSITMTPLEGLDDLPNDSIEVFSVPFIEENKDILPQNSVQLMPKNENREEREVEVLGQSHVLEKDKHFGVAEVLPLKNPPASLDKTTQKFFFNFLTNANCLEIFKVYG